VEADSGDQWTVPIGGGIGKRFMLIIMWNLQKMEQSGSAEFSCNFCFLNK
jgi:hypothetical protein